MRELRILNTDGTEFEPLPAQRAFLESPARNVAYIGGFASGKSTVGAVSIITACLSNPPPKGYRGRPVAFVARYDWDELMNTTWKTLVEMTPREVIADEYKRPPTLFLRNNWVVRGYNLKNFQKLGSEDFGEAWIDECNEEGVDERFYLMLQSRMERSRVGSHTIRLTGNPGGRNWVYHYFFASRFEPGAKRFRNHEGFLAGTNENIYLPESYHQRMKEIYPEDWLAKFYSGSFDVFEGQILSNFNYDTHVVDGFKVPLEWPRYRGLDHGITHPTGCLWIASDFEGNLLAYNEHYRTKLTPEENTKIILEMSQGEEEAIQWTVIDPSTQAKESAGGVTERIIDQYRKAGLYCQPGDNRVKDSIARWKSLLQPDPEHKFPRWHPRAGERGAPHFYIQRHLKHFIWEVGQWKWRDVKPGAVDRERPLEKDDHLMAACRYVIMRSPSKAEVARPASDWDRFLRVLEEMEPTPRYREGNWIGAERL